MPRDYATLIRALAPEGDRHARMTRVVDSIWNALASTGVSWVGFYLDEPGEPDDRRLVLGPHRDSPACSPIGLHGACGQALLAREPLVVRDVAELGSGYIACDPRDRSEVVLPLMDASGTAWGVLDLDSREIGAFDEVDVAGLTEAVVTAGLHQVP